MSEKLRTVDRHRQAVAALLPRQETVELPLQQALGYVLAADVTAPVDLPPFDNSAMDGFAVRRADLGPLPHQLPVSRDIPAGASDVGPLAAGTAARIMTGAPLPAGADLVVPVELTDGGTLAADGTGYVTITAEPGGRSHIRPRGDDVREGSIVLTAHTTLTAAHIAVAAATGHGSLPVYRPVRVLVVSTGSELAEPGDALAPGQIYESNGQMLAAAVTSAGGIARLAHFVADDVPAFERVLRDYASDVDLIITSGGVSAGAYEVVKQALQGAGVSFFKVAMQPGMPQGCGRFEGTPVVTLPGNPVSSFVSFEVFVRPVIRTAMGFVEAERPALRAPLAEALDAPAGKRQFRRGAIDPLAGTVAPIGGPGSHLLGALAAADCLIVIDEKVEHLDAGDEVEVWLIG